MKGLINKKNIYLLVLLVICLLGIIIVPTYAKFGSSYTTADDVVGMSLAFTVKISNIEEYEEVVLAAGQSEQINVQITNSTSSTAYYGVWYKVANSSIGNADISVNMLEDSTVNTTGSISAGSTVTVSLIIKNTTTSEVVVNIGVGNSNVGTNDIEYLGGKKLITGTAAADTIAPTCVLTSTKNFKATS